MKIYVYRVYNDDKVTKEEQHALDVRQVHLALLAKSIREAENVQEVVITDMKKKVLYPKAREIKSEKLRRLLK